MNPLINCDGIMPPEMAERGLRRQVVGFLYKSARENVGYVCN